MTNQIIITKPVQQISEISSAAKELCDLLGIETKALKISSVNVAQEKQPADPRIDLEIRKIAAMPSDFGLQDARRALATMVEAGVASQQLVDVIFDGGKLSTN